MADADQCTCLPHMYTRRHVGFSAILPAPGKESVNNSVLQCQALCGKSLPTLCKLLDYECFRPCIFSAVTTHLCHCCPKAATENIWTNDWSFFPTELFCKNRWQARSGLCTVVCQFQIRSLVVRLWMLAFYREYNPCDCGIHGYGMLWGRTFSSGPECLQE